VAERPNLLLDEPTNHLDFEMRIHSLITALRISPAR
jgi:ATPase subunit of ABC transporter with duplicated ATPase domains